MYHQLFGTMSIPWSCYLMTKAAGQSVLQGPKFKGPRVCVLFASRVGRRRRGVSVQHENIAIPLPDYIQRQQASNTRQYNPSKFRVMGPKTNVYKYSYFPRTILEWNSLPQSLYNIHINLDNFKTVLVDSRM